MNVNDDVADIVLIDKCRRGDEDAFNVLYQRYRLPLYSYLNKLLSNSASVVDDIFQITWTRILQNLPAYTDKQRFLSWAFRIAHNLAVDHFRQQARLQTVELDDRLPDERDTPWEQMDRTTVHAALARAVEELSPEQREVLELRRQGISFKDIAAIQKTGINTVLGRMHYAVKHLQRLMQDYT